MLDLSVVKERQVEMVLPSGKHLHLLRPNLRLVAYVNNYKNLISNIKNEQECHETIVEMSDLILANNKEQYVITKVDIDVLDEMDRLQIINEYMSFIDRIASDPN